MSLLPPVPPTRPLTATSAVSLATTHGRSGVVLRAHVAAGPTPHHPRRSKIWELAETLHCSIIGTCLTNAEVRQMLVRIGAKDAETVDEHELHVLGVLLAGRPDVGAKHLQKALDKRHAATIKQYARAKDEDALRRLWSESTQKGDIPGAYWALLTHPVATEAVVKSAFQDVHMLSHLLGAANRADIQRLRHLEQEMGTLTEKLHRQELQLRDGFRSRDEKIRQLRDMLIRQVGLPDMEAEAGPDHGKDLDALRNVITDLNRRLGQEATRRQHIEERSNELFAILMKTEAKLQTVERERDALRRENELIEDHVVRSLESSPRDGRPLHLSDRTLLYVGGQTRQIPRLKAIVERMGAYFLHHDGGVEHSSSLLPGLVGQADMLCFPVDCISHDAVATIKRLARQFGKPYRPLRTASLASLMPILAAMSETQEVAPAT